MFRGLLTKGHARLERQLTEKLLREEEREMMPVDRKRYPEDWTAIRARIQARAGDRCERCGVKNHTLIIRAVDGSCWYDPQEDCYFRYPSGERIEGYFEADLRLKATEIVCTTAHVDPETKHDKTDCREEALQFLCQACHLAEDLSDHIANRRKSALAKKAVGSLF